MQADDGDGFVTVCREGTLAPGATMVVAMDQRSILLCNVGGVLHAVENRCSHLETPLTRARIIGGLILCPVHGAKFDPATGAAKCPPATAPIKTYPVRVSAGWVEIAAGFAH